MAGGIAAFGFPKTVIVNGQRYTLPDVIGWRVIPGSNPVRYTVFLAGGGSQTVDQIEGVMPPDVVQAPAPAPAPAAVRSPDPDTWSVIGEDATGRAPIIPAGWNTRNQARAIEAAVAPVTVRDFESFGEGGPVLKAEPVSSSSTTPAPSAAGGLGLAAVIALLLFGS